MREFLWNFLETLFFPYLAGLFLLFGFIFYLNEKDIYFDEGMSNLFFYLMFILLPLSSLMMWYLSQKEFWNDYYPIYQYDVELNGKSFKIILMDKIYFSIEWKNIKNLEMFYETNYRSWTKYKVIRFMTAEDDVKELRLIHLKIRRKDRHRIFEILSTLLKDLNIPLTQRNQIQDEKENRQKQLDTISEREQFYQDVREDLEINTSRFRKPIVNSVASIIVIFMFLLLIMSIFNF